MPRLSLSIYVVLFLLFIFLYYFVEIYDMKEALHCCGNSRSPQAHSNTIGKSAKRGRLNAEGYFRIGGYP